MSGVKIFSCLRRKPHTINGTEYRSVAEYRPTFWCGMVGIVAVGTEATNYTGAGKRAIRLLINSDLVIPRFTASFSSCLDSYSVSLISRRMFFIFFRTYVRKYSILFCRSINRRKTSENGIPIPITPKQTTSRRT